jgi:tetrahydromethanopterin S-methyltransferase subunit F
MRHVTSREFLSPFAGLFGRDDGPRTGLRSSKISGFPA